MGGEWLSFVHVGARELHTKTHMSRASILLSL